MASEVDICNIALNNLGASNITALTEDSKPGRLCNQRYEFVRDTVFRAHPWNCLIRRVELAQDSDTPAFGFTYQYTLPADPYCLRVMRLDYLDIDFRVEGRKILCDESTINLWLNTTKEDISNTHVQNVKGDIPKYLTMIEGNMMNFYKNLKKEFSL